jgi:FkbM family methyltransferase
MPATPEFTRTLKVGIEETDLAYDLFVTQGASSQVVVDVGAHRASSSSAFADQGWSVHAFEPDPSNRAAFLSRLGDYENVSLDPRAVSDVDGAIVTLYDSEESTGITSLIPFTDGHRPATEVTTVRLDTYLADRAVPHVDFLKIDTEGNDLLVLRGFPWAKMRPPVVLCEYADNKTVTIGYTTEDLLQYLVDLGYTILISEWHPIERYGIVHSFKQLRLYQGEAPENTSWGNLLAVTDPADAEALLELAPLAVKRRNAARTEYVASWRFDTWRRQALRARSGSI